MGWVINRWLGLIFFTLPLLGIFYYVLHLISHSIIPASNPEDKAERHQRFLIFLSYVWGVQMPMWNVVTTNNYQTADKKIDGKSSSNMFPGKSNNRRSLFPGLIHTDSHQVAGILRGADFRVEGPGVIFTDGEDTPFEIVDLRNKAKKNEKEKPIHAFSQEGIPITAEVSVAFRIDRDEAQQVQVHQVGQVNTPPRKVKENHRDVPSLTFPYSKDKVEKALRLRSRQFKANNETTTERWEDQVLQTAEQAAREVLATRKVKDLWQARENPHSDASAEIAASIKGLIETPLRKNGIQIFSAKASGFKFTNAGEKDDEVIAQQIQTWGVERKRELELLLANTQSKIDRIEQDARVNAQSILLSAIMEGLEHARQHHQGADQEAIARVYLDALRDMIEQQADSHHESEAISALKKAEAEYFKNNG
ncbi:MAG: hypothetical protein HZB50_15725 [Chloroflexi bacterium]|nr:hypothetical protein [Chloroflexota bacterium]